MNNGVRVRYVAVTPVAYKVGMTGFEPAASWSLTKRSTKLSYIPIWKLQWESNPLTGVLQTPPRPTRVGAISYRFRLMYHHILSYLLVPVARIELAMHRLKVCCHTTWLHEHKNGAYSITLLCRTILLNLSEFFKGTGSPPCQVGAPGWTRTTGVSLWRIYSPLQSPLCIPTHIKVPWVCCYAKRTSHYPTRTRT